MEEKDLRELGNQLRCPSGDRGVEVAEMMNDTNIGMTTKTIDLLPFSSTVLEIGPGNAGHLNYMFQKQENATYTGLDISELMVSEASRLNAAAIKSGKANFVLYNGVDIPFEDDKFDAVFTVNTIYFWEKPLLFLGEIRRVMNSGAIFALTFAEASFMEQLPFTKFVFTLYDQNKVTDLAIKAGFLVAHIEYSVETVKNKLGDSVERKFITVLLQND